MRSFRHWNARYVRARLSESWFRWRNAEAPWLTPEAISVLASWLRPTDVGIEWGSGRSTAWIGARVGRLLSLEHDMAWYERVRVGLPPNVELRLYPEISRSEPVCDYVRAADALENESLDFALVDGVTELRDACTRAIIAKLKPGGLLVVDNANWFIPHATHSPIRTAQPASDLWRDVIEQLRAWRCIWTTNDVSDTALWIKPPAGVTNVMTSRR